MIDQHVMQELELIDLKLDGTADPLEEKDEIVLTYNQDLLISVGRGNSGLHVVRPSEDRVEKKHDGVFAGLTQYKNGYMALKQPNKLYIFDERLKVQEIIEVQDPSHAGLHDIKLSKDGFIYIVSSEQNKIIVLDEKTLKKQREIILSTPDTDLHHINDLLIIEDSLIMSMFSVKGGWFGQPIEKWGGAVVEFDRDTFYPKGIVIDHLSAPHSITLKDDSLYYCDSLNLNVSKYNLAAKQKETVAQFIGFTRGLYVDHQLLVVGQSTMRHLQMMNDRFPNVSLDGGLHLYDCINKHSRFINFGVSNPYAILPFGGKVNG